MSPLKSLTGSEGLRSSALLVVGNTFAQGLSGIAIILLSRFIGPEQFGIFSAGFSLALIIASLIDLGLTQAQQQAVPRSDDTAQRNRLFATILYIKVLLTLVVIALIIPLAPWLSRHLQLASSSLLIWLVVANLGSVFFNQLAAMLLSLQRVGQTVLINVLQAASKIGLALVILLTGFANGGQILLMYLALPLLIAPFSSWLLPAWYRLRVKFFRSSWLTMRGMALNNWVASFGSMLIQNADILLVGMLLSAEETGLIGAASRLAMFVAVIGGSLAGALYPRVATYRLQSDLDAFWRKGLLLLSATFGLAMLSALVSGPLITYTVGSQYTAAVPVVSWLIAASWLSVGSIPLIALFYSYDKPWFFSISASLQAMLLVLGNWLLLPAFGIIAAGWVRLGAQLFLIVFSLLTALYSHRQRFGQLPKLI